MPIQSCWDNQIHKIINSWKRIYEKTFIVLTPWSPKESSKENSKPNQTIFFESFRGSPAKIDARIKTYYQSKPTTSQKHLIQWDEEIRLMEKKAEKGIQNSFDLWDTEMER